MLNGKVLLSSQPDEQALFDKLRKIKLIALDMDGTLYRGSTVFPYTYKFLADLKKMGIRYCFLTNNPSKSNSDYISHLRHLGIFATSEEVYTSGQATINYLKKLHPSIRRLFILGTPSMISEFESSGFESVANDPDEVPEAVVVGFDTSLVYDRLARAAWWVAKGKLFVATNPDLVCPTDQRTLLIDCGSICAAIERSTGRKPDVVLGKPQPDMLNSFLEMYNLQSDEVAMVGDRIYTDIEMARRTNSFGVLVLSGEATKQDALEAIPVPDLVTPSIATFGEMLQLSRVGQLR
jgi:HAD superfamily hydrolase (TIGR01450 family)